jgi:hypothetical protein
VEEGDIEPLWDGVAAADGRGCVTVADPVEDGDGEEGEEAEVPDNKATVAVGGVEGSGIEAARGAVVAEAEGGVNCGSSYQTKATTTAS